ncbi:antibiotic biosynthesis monooxygenase [Bacillus coahuilensis p1.1.43]|uniref:Antibiotic biosynthesis monooxygenase n=1 Tax=Bacillus coahuilensis p1.1.43 TaxID=1150625 RepID=A0A147K820_9BACI|nr:antibiotic biosynthesis monooxygenase [Bacillus coahuilensis]KUP06305.1 antibiotic biosynthesis monooxygenase [Bacillus coahuilensis p1.1.43]
MSGYSIFGKLVAKEGELETLSSILLEAAESMKQVESCSVYIVNASKQEQAVFVFEVWENEQAHQASLSLPLTQTLIQKAKPILAGVERLAAMEALGGKLMT